MNVPYTELVSERYVELGVAKEHADLANRFAADERVVVTVCDGGEEAVSPGPLGGHPEAGFVVTFPVGEQDLGDGGPVY